MRSVAAGSFAALSSVESLWSAWRSYARGKGRWPAVAAFALDADTHVFALHRALRNGSFTPDPYRQHVVRDPKVRLISAPSVRDRVLHQAIIAQIGAVYSGSFIHDSYACLEGRGPQRAVLRYLAWSRRYPWRLSLDIRRYFPSVNHDILLDIVFRRLKDRDTRALLAALVQSGGTVYQSPLARRLMGLEHDPLPSGTGLAIGSSLSQWAANLYLDGLDHFVKRELRIRAYVRYMDDFTLFADDRDILEHAEVAIRDWLSTMRRLSLNPRRRRLVAAAEPSTYLGYRVSQSGLTPGKKTRRRMRNNLRAAAERGAEPLRCSLASYQSLVRFG